MLNNDCVSLFWILRFVLCFLTHKKEVDLLKRDETKRNLYYNKIVKLDELYFIYRLLSDKNNVIALNFLTVQIN